VEKTFRRRGDRVKGGKGKNSSRGEREKKRLLFIFMGLNPSIAEDKRVEDNSIKKKNPFEKIKRRGTSTRDQRRREKKQTTYYVLK